MIKIIHFPKKCPLCKVALKVVQKLHARWLECPNDQCVGVKDMPTLFKGILRDISEEYSGSHRHPYTYAHQRT